MRPRREGGLHGGPRLWADGAGSTESLGGPPEMEFSKGREADGTGGSGGQVTRMVPTPCPLFPLWCLPMSLVSTFLRGLHKCPRWPSLLHPPPPDGSSGTLLCVPAASLSSGTFLLSALPPTQSYPSTAVPRTSEQQGPLVSGHLFQSADEETEAQGGEVPCPRSHSELVSEPAQGPASYCHPHSPRLSPTSAASFPCPCFILLPLYSALPLLHCSDTPQCLCVLQGPPHQHLCAGPRALSAYGMRPWQVGSGGNSAPDSQWGEALSHSAPGTRLGSDSDSAVQVPWQAPMAKVRGKGPCLYEPPTSCGSTNSWGRGLPSCPLCLSTSPACLCPGPCGPAAALWLPRIWRGMGWLR